MGLEKKIIQRAELYLVQNNKARHIKHWPDYVKICDELGINTGYRERTFLDEHEFPPIGLPITEWPEKEYKIGPERMMFCVSPFVDFQRIKDLGVTVIQAYDIYWQSDYGRDYLDQAASYGLKVLYYLGALTQDLIRDGKPWRKEECERIVKLFDSHEALWGWQAWDEPDGGSDNPAHIIPMQVQQNVYNCVKTHSSKPFVSTMRGGTRGWHLVNLNLLDVIIPTFYAYNGTGEIDGKKPLVALGDSAKQCSEYLKDYSDKPVTFMFQCCDEPAVGTGNHNTKVPQGHIEEQFNIINKYNLFTGGLSLWAWDHGYFGPETSDEMYNEIKNLFNKIKGGK